MPKAVSIGSQGEVVTRLQALLREHGYELPAFEVSGNFFGPVTWQAVRQFQKAQGLPQTGEADEETLLALSASKPAPSGKTSQAKAPSASDAPPLPPSQKTADQGVSPAATPADSTPPLRVHGQVTSGGIPVSGVGVTVADMDVQGFDGLNQNPAFTDKDGNYNISYEASQFQLAEKGTADLVFVLFAPQGMNPGFIKKFTGKRGDGTQLQQIALPLGNLDLNSPILFNAGPDEIINLDISPAEGVLASEYERLLAEVGPLLVRVNVPNNPNPTVFDRLALLGPSDLDFLAGETGKSRTKWLNLSTAVQLSQGPFGNDVDPAIFYGLFAEGFPLDLPSLAKKSSVDLAQALEKACDDNIIPAAERALIVNSVSILVGKAAEQALLTPVGEGRAALGDFLKVTSLPADLHATFVNAYANRTGAIDNFWKSLRQNPQFQQPGVVDSIQLMLQFSLLSQNHLPLVQNIFSTFAPRSISDLAGLTKTQWTTLINANNIGVPSGVPGATPDEQVSNYVDSIRASLQVAFPTIVTAGFIANNTAINITPQVRADLGTFFRNAPDFDLRSSTVTSYIAAHGDTAFAGIAVENRPAMLNALKRTHRLFQISHSGDALSALLATDIGSAASVASMPLGSFVAKYKDALGGADQAQAIHERAVHIHARSVFIYSHLYQSAFDVQPRALGDISAVQAVLKQLPNYPELFGSLDFCACEDCHSVLSPTAYFVDLLEFLRKSTSNSRAITPLQVLLGDATKGVRGRRPDLAQIKLSCENTNTLIPYVDLVNEILESYIVFQSPLSAPPNDSSDDITAAELAANPENVNLQAYKKIKDALFPFTLPFDLPLETVRGYLEFMGVSRHDVMATFQADQSQAAQNAIDAEFLKISEEEYKILTGLNFDGTPVVPARGTFEFYDYDSSVAVAQDRVWSDDALPPGALTNKPWNFVSSNPAPFSGTVAHKITTTGEDADEFHLPNPPLTFGPDDVFFTMVFLDPVQTPDSIVLGWEINTKTGVAFYAKDPSSIPPSPNMVVKLLPPTGQWIRLEVPTRDVGFTGQTDLEALAFIVSKGTVTFDRTGVRNLIWNELLARVPEFLQRTGIAYVDLVGLLETNFINPDPQAPQAITLFSLDGTCNLDQTVLRRLDSAPPDDAAFQKLHLFIRLWRKLGWSLLDTGRLLTSLNAQAITPGILHAISTAVGLQQDLNVPVQVLVSMWSGIDQQGDDSLYRKFFLNRAVLSIDPVFTAPAPNALLKDHVPALLAAFRISEKELSLVRSDSGLADDAAVLTIPNLSTIYHYVALARALKLRIADLLSLKTLWGKDPFASPDSVRLFVNLARQVRDSGFTIVQLDYLFRHISQAPTGLAPQLSVILQLIGSLRDGLAKIQADNTLVDDPQGEVTRAELSLIFEPAVVNEAVHMIDGTQVYSAPLASLPSSLALPAKLSFEKGVLRYKGAMTLAEFQAITALPQADAAFQAAVQALFEAPALFIANTFSGFLNTLDDARTLLRNFASLDDNGLPVLLDAGGQVTPDPAKAAKTAIQFKFGYFRASCCPTCGTS
jgi:peptidoglycan hydrolase-like protein with peptidoglycan-binding domain